MDEVERCINRRKRLAEILAVIGYGGMLWLGSLIITYVGIGQIYAYFIGVLFSVIALFVAGIIHEEIYDEFGTTLMCEARLFREHRGSEDEDEGE